MKANARLLFPLLIAVFGVGVLSLVRFLDEPLEVTDGGTAQSLPEIDFVLLDQARSLDLIDKELDYPAALRELEGRQVTLIGFMAPYDNLNDMSRCMMVPSYVGCTFCSPPSLNQVVYVTQGEDESSGPYAFIEEPSHVTGTLRLSTTDSKHEGHAQGFLYSIENAVVEPHYGEGPVRPKVHGIGNAGASQPVHQQGIPLPPVEGSELIQQVTELFGREPLRPITIEPVSGETFAAFLRSSLEATFPDKTRAALSQAFTLLGMLPDEADWIDALTDAQLSRRVAATDAKGERILLLDSIDADVPYSRLELVGEIADAITRQHFPQSVESEEESDDARRAHEALRRGIRTTAMYRYARSRGISSAAQPPPELAEAAAEAEFTSLGFELWQSLPGDIGAFFADFIVGATGPMTGIDPALAQPPSTTMECFRPRWYQDATLWQPDPVPSDFADNVLDIAPLHTDVMGIGSLVPWLVKWYPVDGAKKLAGRWAGDRWALWKLPDGAHALLLEIRWQDEESALKFHKAIPGMVGMVPLHEEGSRTVRLLRSKSPTALDRLTSAFAVSKPQ